MTLRPIPVTQSDQVERMRLLRNATSAGYANYNDDISEAQQILWWEANRERVQAWLYMVDGPPHEVRYLDPNIEPAIVYYSGVIVGFGLLATHDDGTVWTTVGVHPEHTGHNFGKRIISHLISQAPGRVYCCAQWIHPAALRLHTPDEWAPCDGPDPRLAYFQTIKGDPFL